MKSGTKYAKIGEQETRRPVSQESPSGSFFLFPPQKLIRTEFVLPEPIQTDRLAIYPSDESSALRIQELVHDRLANEPYFIEPESRDGHATWEHWMQRNDDWQSGRITLAVRKLNSSQLIGCLRFELDSLSYFVEPKYWGRGYGTEMVGACCDTIPGLLKLHSVRASVIRENAASRRVLEKTGFLFDGLRSQTWPGRLGQVAVLKYKLNCLNCAAHSKSD